MSITAKNNIHEKQSTRMSEKESSFRDWFFENFHKLPSFYPEKDSWNTEVLEKMRDRFGLPSESKDKFKPKLWTFHIENYNDKSVKINIFIDLKGKARLSATLTIEEKLWDYTGKRRTFYNTTEKKFHLTSNPLDFIEDLEERYRTSTNAKKFGL